ncbi:hypothetical protein B5F53_06750 [Blautia sp. An249]|uniref:YecA family protein n=1 Tax=Blautia sp. An249 TaxID=1965603 RepID=UPI000B3AFE4F|nr:SEC-C metal-binding domain-containing protein [Blautia sp. An249]OUO79647.1 hypothetical protein B5F53_06750 [Blautia sp. An249]
MRKSEIKEMDEFLNRLDIDNDMLSQMASDYTENFMIQGEETKDLKELLKRAPEALLDRIIENWTEETDMSVSRNKKEKCVYDLILESIRKEFIFLDKEDIEILLRTMNGHPLSMIQMAVLQENYCCKGWVFMVCKDNECDFVVPDEIREIILTNLEDEKAKNLLGLVTGVRLTLRACINLFGIVEKKKVLQIIMNQMFEYPDLSEDEKKELEWLPEKAEETLQILCQREEGAFWQEGEWFISNDFENRKQYKQFLKQVSGQEYYIPDRKEIYLYAEHIVDIENPCYKKMLKDLTGLMRDKTRADNLMFELEYMVAQNDFSAQDIMNLLFARGIAFKSRKSGENFAGNCSAWVYTVRRWSNRGFTDEELGRQKKEINVTVAPEWKMGTIQTPKVQKKIGRNDPCPCGSGKKYKKCCGR